AKPNHLVLISAWFGVSGSCCKSCANACRVSLELLGVAVVALTAHLGGFLSGVNIAEWFPSEARRLVIA
ncbi:MAG: hypothetical protein WA324_19095, partial [Bryobacteraceae bacterium]